MLDFVDSPSVQKPKTTNPPKLPKAAPDLQLPSVTVSPGQALQFVLKLSLPPNTKLAEEAPSSWFFTSEGKKNFAKSQHMYAIQFITTQSVLSKVILLQHVDFE